jgi:hypothetical protein
VPPAAELHGVRQLLRRLDSGRYGLRELLAAKVHARAHAVAHAPHARAHAVAHTRAHAVPDAVHARRGDSVHRGRSGVRGCGGRDGFVRQECGKRHSRERRLFLVGLAGAWLPGLLPGIQPKAHAAAIVVIFAGMCLDYMYARTAQLRRSKSSMPLVLDLDSWVVLIVSGGLAKVDTYTDICFVVIAHRCGDDLWLPALVLLCIAVGVTQLVPMVYGSYVSVRSHAASELMLDYRTFCSMVCIL